MSLRATDNQYVFRFLWKYVTNTVTLVTLYYLYAIIIVHKRQKII